MRVTVEVADQTVVARIDGWRPELGVDRTADVVWELLSDVLAAAELADATHRQDDPLRVIGGGHDLGVGPSSAPRAAGCRRGAVRPRVPARPRTRDPLPQVRGRAGVAGGRGVPPRGRRPMNSWR